MLGRLAGWLCSADQSAGRPGKAGVDGFFSHLLSRHPVYIISNLANALKHHPKFDTIRLQVSFRSIFHQSSCARRLWMPFIPWPAGSGASVLSIKEPKEFLGSGVNFGQYFFQQLSKFDEFWLKTGRLFLLSLSHWSFSITSRSKNLAQCQRF